MSDPEDPNPDDPNPDDPEAAEREARRKELQRQRELRIRRARGEQEGLERSSGPSEIDSGTVALWTFLGVGYYLLAMAVWGSLLFLLSSTSLIVPLAWLSLVVPVAVHQLTVNSMSSSERASERRGLGIALALFYGLTCLSPLIICGGMLLGGKGLNIH